MSYFVNIHLIIDWRKGNFPSKAMQKIFKLVKTCFYSPSKCAICTLKWRHLNSSTEHAVGMFDLYERSILKQFAVYWDIAFLYLFNKNLYSKYCSHTCT